MTIAIINDDAGFSTVGGGWTNDADPAAYGDDYLYAGPSGTGTNKARWSLTGLTAGDLVSIAITWTAGANRATNVPWTVYDSDGTTILAQGTINQEVAPSSFTYDGSNWQNLCRRVPSGTSIHVEITDNANEYVIADAAYFDYAAPPSTHTFSIGPGGDWSNSATWTNGVPVPGIIAVVLGNVVIDADVEVEDLEIDGPLTVDDGFTLTVTGSVLQGNAPFTLGAGSSLEFDTAAADVVWTRGSEFGQRECKIIANGTANIGDPVDTTLQTTGGNHARIFKTGSNKAYFTVGDTAGAFYLTGGYELNYCEIENLTDSAGFLGLPLYTDQDLLALHCAFDGCARVFGSPQAAGEFTPAVAAWLPSGNHDFRIEYNSFINGLSTSGADVSTVYCVADSSTGSGVQTYEGNGGGRVYFNLPAGSVGSTSPNYFDEIPQFTANAFATFGEGQVFRSSNNSDVMPRVPTNCYLLADNRPPGGVGNQHYIAIDTPADCIGNVFENVTHGIDMPDAFFGVLGSSTVRNNLIIPSIRDGVTSSCLLNPSTHVGWNVDAHHNTCAGYAAQLIFIETFVDDVTIFDKLRSNLIASPDLDQAYLILDGANNVDVSDSAENAYNWVHNGHEDEDPDSLIVRYGYQDVRMTTSPAGPNTETFGVGYDGDGPQFVDPTRNAARYAVYNGWIGAEPALAHSDPDWITWLFDALDAFRNGLIADPREGPTFRNWVRDGFAPQNALLVDAGHDGATIGAVEPTDVVSKSFSDTLSISVSESFGSFLYVTFSDTLDIGVSESLTVDSGATLKSISDVLDVSLSEVLTDVVLGASLFDTFEGTAGVRIENHTSDSNHRWRVISIGNLFLSGTGSLYSDNVGGTSIFVLSNRTPTSADQFIEITHREQSHLNQGYAGLLRATTLTNSYADLNAYDAFRIEGSVVIGKWVNGSYSILASNTSLPGFDEGNKFTFEVIGTAPVKLTVRVNGVIYLTYNDSSSPITAFGNPGLRYYSDEAGSATTGHHVGEITSGEFVSKSFSDTIDVSISESNSVSLGGTFTKSISDSLDISLSESLSTVVYSTEIKSITDDIALSLTESLVAGEATDEFISVRAILGVGQITIQGISTITVQGVL